MDDRPNDAPGCPASDAPICPQCKKPMEPGRTRIEGYPYVESFECWPCLEVVCATFKADQAA